jgi:hypothetical protein
LCLLIFSLKFCSKFVLFISIILDCPFSDRLSVAYSRITYFWLFLYPFDELLDKDFWNTIEEIKEQYFMKIRSAVLEILQENCRTERNVERKKHEFSQISNTNMLKIVTKQICSAVCIFWQIGALPAKCCGRRPPS